MSQPVRTRPPRRPSAPLLDVDMPALQRAITERLARPRRGEPARTISEWATVLGFSPSAFSRIKRAAEQGTVDRPSAPVLLTICDWARVDPRQLTTRRPAAPRGAGR